MENNILRFEHPEYLYGLLIIPIFIAVYVAMRIINKRKFKKFADNKFLEFLVPLSSNSRINIKFIFNTSLLKDNISLNIFLCSSSNLL